MLFKSSMHPLIFWSFDLYISEKETSKHLLWLCIHQFLFAFYFLFICFGAKVLDKTCTGLCYFSGELFLLLGNELLYSTKYLKSVLSTMCVNTLVLSFLDFA